MKKTTPQESLLSSLLIIFLVFASFPLLNLAGVKINQIQIIGFLVFLIIIYHRFLFPQIARRSPRVALYLELAPFFLLLPLLVLSTGGFVSPLLIVIHLSAIALAILLSPRSALTYILSALVVLLLQVFTFQPQAVETDFSLIIISCVSFIATIPLFFLFSKHEETREEWLNYLDSQISTNEAQERTLLANLTDAVIVIDEEQRVARMNKKAQDLTGFSQTEALGKKLLEILELNDSSGKALTSSPVDRVLASGKAFIQSNLVLKTPHPDTKVKVRFSPIKDRDSKLLGVLIVVSEASNASEIQEIQNDNLSLALFKFNSLLSDIRSYNATLQNDSQVRGTTKTYLDRVSHINDDLLRLTDDFLLSVRLDQEEVSFAETQVDIGELITKLINNLQLLAQKEKIGYQISKIKEKVIIKTDKTLVTKALTNLLVISSRLSQDKAAINIDVLVDPEKVKLYYNFKVHTLDLDTRALKQKFFGGGELFVTLPKATGLEVYLADNLLQLLGGSLSINQNPKDPKEVEFLVELPL